MGRLESTYERGMSEILPPQVPWTTMPSPAHRVTARALALGARIDASGLERPDTISLHKIVPSFKGLLKTAADP